MLGWPLREGYFLCFLPGFVADQIDLKIPFRTADGGLLLNM
jgi:hypothetical protein